MFKPANHLSVIHRKKLECLSRVRPLKILIGNVELTKELILIKEFMHNIAYVVEPLMYLFN